MAKKKSKRCKTENCETIIGEEFTHCFKHKGYLQTLNPDLKKYYCDNCGSVSHSVYYQNCHHCGSKVEEVRQ